MKRVTRLRKPTRLRARSVSSPTRTSRMPRSVIGAGREEDGKHPVVFGLVNEAGDQIAQADPVAGKVGVFADPHFENAELAVALELDAAQLENGFGAVIRAGQRLGRGKNLR